MSKWFMLSDKSFPFVNGNTPTRTAPVRLLRYMHYLTDSRLIISWEKRDIIQLTNSNSTYTVNKIFHNTQIKIVMQMVASVYNVEEFKTEIRISPLYTVYILDHVWIDIELYNSRSAPRGPDTRKQINECDVLNASRLVSGIVCGRAAYEETDIT